MSCSFIFIPLLSRVALSLSCFRPVCQKSTIVNDKLVRVSQCFTSHSYFPKSTKMKANEKKTSIPITNYHPSCVNVELTLIRASDNNAEENDNENGHTTIGLVQSNVSILFGEGRLQLKGGSFRFGIRRGELSLDLSGARCPISLRNFVHILPASVSVEHSVEHTTGSVLISDDYIQWKIFVSPPALQFRSELHEKESAEEGKKEVMTFSTELYTIIAQGSDTCPTWIFEALPGHRILRGGLKDHTLCHIQLLDGQWGVDVRFRAERDDIIVTDVEGVFPKSVSRDKQGIIRATITKWMKRNVRLIMSEGSVKYE